jgi:hypothetical protein
MATKDHTTRTAPILRLRTPTMIVIELVTAGLATALVVTLVAILIGAVNV